MAVVVLPPPLVAAALVVCGARRGAEERPRGRPRWRGRGCWKQWKQQASYFEQVVAVQVQVQVL